MGNLQQGLVVLPGCPGPFPYRTGSHTSQDGVVIPYSVFLRDLVAASSSLEAHLKESWAAFFVWHFSMSAAEKQNQPKGLFNCNIKKKIMLFQGKKEELSTPSVSSAILYLLILSHSNPNKHIHHCKKCHSSEHSPWAYILPQMFPSPIKPSANY